MSWGLQMHYGNIYILSINTEKSHYCSVLFKTKSILPCVTGVVKLFSPLLPGGGVSGAIQAIVVNVPEPLAFTLGDMLQLRNLRLLFNIYIYAPQNLQKHTSPSTRPFPCQKDLVWALADSRYMAVLVRGQPCLAFKMANPPTSLHNQHFSMFPITALWSFHYKLQTLEQTFFCGIKSQGLIIFKMKVKTAAEV